MTLLNEREDLLQLHREHLIAGNLELACKEELHPVRVGVLLELLEVLETNTST